MRKLLASLVLVPALAVAQTPVRPPSRGPAGARPTTPGAVTPQPGVSPAPAPGTPAERPGVSPAPGPGQPAPTAPTQPGPQRPGAARGAEPLRTTDSKCVPLKGRFMLSFNKAEIVDVLEQASRWTCRNFVYTEDVARGKITLLSKTPVTADEAYAAFLAALNSNNIAVYATGRYYKLIRTADSKKNPIPTYTGEDSGTPANEQPITKVIRLRYADADQMRGVIGNFLSPQGADVQSIPPDMLIVTDIGLNLRRIERIMEAVDRAGAGDLVRIVQIRYASAKDIADKINQIFQAQGGKAGRPRTIAGTAPAVPGRAQPAAPPASAGVEVSVSKIIPDERTNKLIIIADEKSFQRIVELIDQLDVPTSGDGGIHVVFLRNANAEELAQTLSNLAQGQAAKRPGAPVVPASTPPGAVSGTRPSGAAGVGEVTAELFAGEVKITADKAQNALLIQASGSDFAAVSRLIEKLDRPRRQVFVEAVIVEVNLRNDTEFGVGAHTAIPFDYEGESGIIPISSNPGRVSSFGLLEAVGLGGFLTGFTGPVTAELRNLGLNIPSIGFLIQALQTSADANVLSTPHIVATDNEESEITVGQNVPFQAGFTPAALSNLLGASGAGSAVGNLLGQQGALGLSVPIQRQPVELRLKIKPQINEGGNVRLSIEEQTEEITDRDPQLGPTTAKRSVKTQIVAKDQSTIVIGGLIQERNIRSVKKVPFLGSLPVLGWLFRDTITTKSKTNLLLFLTPYIIRDESDYRRIYEKKRKEQQEFTEQFYGRQPTFEVSIDFSRKAGPYTKMRAGVVDETSKLENGGRGGPGERFTTPPGGEPTWDRPISPPISPPTSPPAQAPEDGTPVDRLDVQPDVLTPEPEAAPPPPTPPAPTPPAASPPAATPPAAPPNGQPRTE
jgi:general secretion pathway protein D